VALVVFPSGGEKTGKILNGRVWRSARDRFPKLTAQPLVQREAPAPCVIVTVKDLNWEPSSPFACRPPARTVLACRCGSRKYVAAEQSGSCRRRDKEVARSRCEPGVSHSGAASTECEQTQARTGRKGTGCVLKGTHHRDRFSSGSCRRVFVPAGRGLNYF